MNRFLPISKADMEERGWDQLDFVLVSADAYVDHPSFGAAIIARVLESQGFRVGVLAQPDWRQEKSFLALGRPRLAFMVSGGNIDSMVAHYTAAKRRRSEDEYSPGGKAGFRPDRPTIVYTRQLKKLCPEIPVIIGGLEASLRRFAHYDYWDDAVRPSVLVDAGADLLSYGMGENQTIQIARRLGAGKPVSSLTDIPGTCYLSDAAPAIAGAVSCASFEKVAQDKTAYARAFKIQYEEHDAVYGKTIIQKHGDRYLVQNPPMPPLEQQELDWVWSLPFTRYYHPSYEEKGGIPAIQEVEFSIMHNRGCFGACNFCSIATHQGRRVTCRSEKSVLAEAREMVQNPRFKGYIHDVGGPTANFRVPSCAQQLEHGLCRGRKCLAPVPCKNLRADHHEYLDLLRKLRALPGVKRVFIRSGIRFDYLLEDQDDSFFQELVEHHVSGQLKVAPEHCSAAVLDRMGKPHIETFNRFVKKFYQITEKVGREQYLVPYLMSSHPGSTLKDAVQLAVYLKKNRIRPEQVQDFYPTPGTVSTCMFYTGIDPLSGNPVFVPKSPKEKAMQRALLQYYRPEMRPQIIEALKLAGRADLIGTGPDCLVPPAAGGGTANRQRPENKSTAQNARPKTAGRNDRRAGKSPVGKGKSKGRKSR
ncbi:MAG: YgiQ family radical SAM protein [Oscillospiraceae bacterium]|nr:YgiQ family radical SAM protein [Oscillospiraceae bacterium]